MSDVLIVLGSSTVGLLLLWLERAVETARSDLLGGESR